MTPVPIPQLGIELPPFPQGAIFAYLFQLTIAANLPNPSSWTSCRMSLIAVDGTVLSSDLPSVTISSSGPGPWQATVTVPFGHPGTQTFPASSVNKVSWQLDIQAPGFEDLLMAGETLCIKPKRALP